MNELKVADIREMVETLKKIGIKEPIRLPLRDDIRLTVGGAVWIPGRGYMHPDSFKDIAGEKALEYLKTLPRVFSEYDE